MITVVLERGSLLPRTFHHTTMESAMTRAMALSRLHGDALVDVNREGTDTVVCVHAGSWYRGGLVGRLFDQHGQKKGASA